MKTNTLSITISAPKSAVIHYLADIDNFPEWATEFCQELKKEHNHYKIVTPMGERYLRIQANEYSGEVNFFATSDPEGIDYLPSKVTEINQNSCEYMINFSQPNGVTDELYQRQCSAIKIELQNIQNNFKQY